MLTCVLYRSSYLPSNLAIASVIFRDFDVHFQGLKHNISETVRASAKSRLLTNFAAVDICHLLLSDLGLNRQGQTFQTLVYRKHESVNMVAMTAVEICIRQLNDNTACAVLSGFDLNFQKC